MSTLSSGIWGPGWVELIPGSVTTITSTSTTPGPIMGVKNVTGRTRVSNEIAGKRH